MSNQAKLSLKERIFKEIKSALVIAFYLWVYLTVSQLHRGIILAEHNIPYSYAQGLIFAVINAWVLAKFVLIGEGLGIGKSWHKRPLFYSILFKAAVFGVILKACQLIEAALSRMWRAKSFAAGLPDLSLPAVMDGLAATVIAFVVLIPFFAAREFSRVLGKDEWQALLLRRET